MRRSLRGRRVTSATTMISKALAFFLPHVDALLGRTLSDFAAIAFEAFEDTSQHVEAIRSFICGRSF